MRRNEDVALIAEMHETAHLIRGFDFSKTAPVADEIRRTKRVFISGEGSSRILPGHNFISEAYRLGIDIAMGTDGAYQAMDYDLSNYVVLVASNSGQTKETLSLVRKLNAEGHGRVYGVTATPGSPLAMEARHCILLACGAEKAVAATKSVVEQALVYQSVLAHLTPRTWEADKVKAAVLAEAVMSADLDPGLIDRMAQAHTVFFAGANNGVAEELALKTNEITRKPSNYLEGTLALHGIEEVMTEEDVVVLLEPRESEFEKFHAVFEKGVGTQVVALSSKPTPFATIHTPSLDGYGNLLALMAGWNLLVQTGLRLGVDLDKPQRARKVGNSL